MDAHPRGRRSRRGFTLIEVLIALAIISIALAAFVRLTSQTATNLGRLEQRSLAMLSAQAALGELKLDSLPAPGLRQQACPQAGRAFVCRVRIDPPQDGMSPVAVEVYADRDSTAPLAGLQSVLPEKRR